MTELPDIIWTYDANGNRLHGRPNYDKPGVFEQVQRDAFDNECWARPPRSNLDGLIMAARVRRFEASLKKERT